MTTIDYTELAWKDLRKLAKDRGISGKQKQHAIIAALKNQDSKDDFDGIPELEPHPVEVTGPKRAGPVRHLTVSNMNAAGSPMNGAVRLLDQEGNMIAMVYRTGRIVDKERVVLDFDGNLEKIMNAF